MLRHLRQALFLAGLMAAPVWAADCTPVDFLTLPLPQGGDPVVTALRGAYPALHADAAGVRLADGSLIPMGQDMGRAPAARLADPSLREQFHDVYPLAFDLTAREVPWHDPGRARVEALFAALYGGSEPAVGAHLKKVAISGKAKASFLISEQQGAACQMRAALVAVEALSSDWGAAFRNVGGSFNWRRIAGTTRMSAHSYGIAFDLNADLGGYWRWSGRAEGDAGAYDNRIPQDVVQVFERHGFIWGGKWHHFDGMHFEYRPEIILYARLMGQAVPSR
ncbi:MAG: M15 family metallopeptidase [Paracoccaceae bacterium]